MQQAEIRRNEEETAVSPVIATILMVAITVVLAGVLYVWANSLASEGTDTSVGTLNTYTTEDADDETGPGAEDTLVKMQMTGKDDLAWSFIKITLSVGDNVYTCSVVAGDDCQISQAAGDNDNAWEPGEYLFLSEGTDDICSEADCLLQISVTHNGRTVAGDGVSGQGGNVGNTGGSGSSSGSITTSWESLANMSTGRGDHASVVLNDKLYVIGGRLCNSINCADPMTTSSVEMYDISTKTWEHKASLSGDAGNLVAVTYNSKIYVIGGHSINGNGNSADRSYFLEYDPSTDSWNSIGNQYCRSQHCQAVVMGSKLYVMGKLSSSTSGVSNYDALKSYDFSTSSWSTLASMNTGRAHFGAAVYGGEIYVMGGQSGSGSYDLTDSVEVYNPSSDTWSYHTTIPSSQLSDSSCGNDYTEHYLGGSSYPMLAENVGSKIFISSIIAYHSKPGSTCTSDGKMLVYDVPSNSWASGDNYSSSRQIYTSDHVAASGTKLYYSGGSSGNSLSNEVLLSYTP